jgi:hypothetical protein
VTTELSKHDMLPRLAEDEPGFLLAARDARAEGFVRLYAAARRHDLQAMDAIYNILRRVCMREPVRSTDAEHAISASNRANDMYAWRKKAQPTAPGLRDEFQPQPEICGELSEGV